MGFTFSIALLPYCPFAHLQLVPKYLNTNCPCFPFSFYFKNDQLLFSCFTFAFYLEMNFSLFPFCPITMINIIIVTKIVIVIVIVTVAVAVAVGVAVGVGVAVSSFT
jgi:hypothetical protein